MVAGRLNARPAMEARALAEVGEEMVQFHALLARVRLVSLVVRLNALGAEVAGKRPLGFSKTALRG